MAALKFCANISWLFTELSDFSKRICAAASAGFQAVEAAWLYDSDLSELQKAKEAAGVEFVLINTPPGDLKAGDLGLGAVPGRELEFRQGLDLTLKYAKGADGILFFPSPDYCAASGLSGVDVLSWACAPRSYYMVRMLSAVDVEV
uniref:Putative hydroxypyruvate isomerase n=1 Tax=Fundulus heteroclitus TaxID=8078 RepID=A0A3Q2PJS4_FUNHE